MNDEEYDKKIGVVGNRLKSVDRMLVHLLARRIRLAEEVAMLKIEWKKPLFNPEREEKRIENVCEWAKAEGLNPEFARSLLYGMIRESCKTQMDVTDVLRLGGSPEKFQPSLEVLRSNLLTLTDLWAPKYDTEYGKMHPATVALNRFERNLIDKMIAQVPDRGLALDLGCGTGREIRRISKQFEALKGFDVSESMIRFGKQALVAESIGNVSLEVCDIEKGLPVKGASVSLIIMNFGTGSDVFDLKMVLSEVRRVLMPSGRFVISFYNKEAWTQRVFMPWPLGLVAAVDQARNCLEVWANNRAMPIYARPYTLEEIESLMPDHHLCLLHQDTYPTLSAILPAEITNAVGLQGAAQRIDDMIAQTEMGLGAYIVTAGEKV